MSLSSDTVRAQRARISFALSQFTVPLLARTYRTFDGDMVAALVLGEIAHRNVEHWLANEGNPAEALDDPQARRRVMRPCNALSIAEACGLPRETVRRKVNRLIEQAYVERSEDGHLFLTLTVGDGFDDSTADTAQALLDTADRLRNILAQPTGATAAKTSLT